MTNQSLILYHFWSFGNGFTSTQIRWWSRLPGVSMDDTPSHQGLIRSDGKGWEAHYATGGWNRITAAMLRDWLVEREGHRIVHWRAPLADAEVRDLSRHANDMLGIWDYATIQNIRLGLGVRVPHTPGLVNCSEACSRISAQWMDWRQLTGIRSWDRHRPSDTIQAVRGELVEGLPPFEQESAP